VTLEIILRGYLVDILRASAVRARAPGRILMSEPGSHERNVTLLVGTFSVTIPTGSFKLNLNGRFAFQGVINGVSMQVLIAAVGNNIFTFNAVGTGVDLTGLTNPVTVVSTIGIDTGSTTVTAQFQ
jgi:hypothetical protein